MQTLEHSTSSVQSLWNSVDYRGRHRKGIITILNAIELNIKPFILMNKNIFFNIVERVKTMKNIKTYIFVVFIYCSAYLCSPALYKIIFVLHKY